MKQSIRELKELNEENIRRISELQKSLDNNVKAKTAEGLSKNEQDKIQANIIIEAQEIECRQRAIESNENIKKQIEESLKQNAEIQEKYLSLVVKLENHKKKDTSLSFPKCQVTRHSAHCVRNHAQNLTRSCWEEFR